MLDLGIDVRSRAEGAILAAAAGDALGWPQEDRARRIGGSKNVEPKLDFALWRRRDGGRFAAHEETIEPGDYSDDTQLILALARSLKAKDAWWERWTSTELPFWLLYERGGGGATKRAARSWASGTPPWLGKTSEDYFRAGGNGVAMRVLPHCLYGATSEDFQPIASAVVKDGIATHGHPVAHLGALVYAFALWRALRRDHPLDYGAVVADTKAGVETWSRLPEGLPDGWRTAADMHAASAYASLWIKTVDEVLRLLTVVETGLQQGALSIDRETLSQLGAFERSTNGAGTVTAISAIFLASRYASRPEQGLIAGAFAHGADTDTLASMTGGLLGAINGRDWLGTVVPRIQDHSHLIQTARGALNSDEEPPLEDKAPRRPPQRLWRTLTEANVGSEISLPDGRNGAVERVIDVPSPTRHEIKIFVVRTADGQTLRFKKVSVRQQPPIVSPMTPSERERPVPTRPRHLAALAIEVSNIERSLSFYRDLLGLELTARTAEYVSFNGVVVLVSRPGASDMHGIQPSLSREMLRPRQPKILVFVTADEVEPLRSQLQIGKVPVTPITAARGRPRFQCLDPDGNVVEVGEAPW